MQKRVLKHLQKCKRRDNNSLTHGTMSQKKINETVDQRRKQVIVYEKMQDIILNIC